MRIRCACGKPSVLKINLAQDLKTLELPLSNFIPDEIRFNICPYCFMSLHHLEGEDCDHIKPLKPLTADQYLNAYYPMAKQAEMKADEQAEFNAMIAKFDTRHVLKLAEVKKIFPAMFKK